MFIVDTNIPEESVSTLNKIKRFVGYVPPHFELFATLNPKRFEMFINEIFYLSLHKSINPDFFAFIRFYIAAKNSFTYCYNFNTKLLLQKGYSQELLDTLEKNEKALPLDEKHQKLFSLTLQAINIPDTFTCNEINTLKSIGWSDADIYDALDHGAFLFKFSKVLKAYSL